MIPLAQPDISELEKELVLEVLDSGQLSRGPMLRKFEAQFATLTKTKYALGVSSGTSGLIMSLQAMEIGSGDEVITVSYTVPATVNAIISVGATPILIDIDLDTRGMSPTCLKRAITPQTKAVIVVHSFGQAADIDSIIAICESYGIPVIEDACEATGNCFKGKALGSWGVIGVFGFYANKQVTTGEGGMIVTNNSAIADKIIKLRNNGRKMDGRWLDQDSVGTNSRLNELSAAIGFAQLRRLESIRKKRQKVNENYAKFFNAFKPITLPCFSQHEYKSMWFAYVIHIDNSFAHHRDELCQSLGEDGIACGRYFSPIHLQPFYQKQFSPISLPNTEILARNGLALPFFNNISEKDIQTVVDKVKFNLCRLSDSLSGQYQCGIRNAT
ncbi:DegT/DnrJ/EryC1/StrS aminotransferase family protein [Aliikangiella sp. G2MR2-5]|uniref:DegT/DnrJ/EryC1/StrS family aminotransferase n=1 Tax=Aliikangiella sp. G2MR2-5 TaxID=2788943 RepID=UPI0018A9E4F9|nr:DegT/DnrJ/EryC1/StrS family aminotransferase [Aliikangiella sp. G2MR2-5]